MPGGAASAPDRRDRAAAPAPQGASCRIDTLISRVLRAAAMAATADAKARGGGGIDWPAGRRLASVLRSAGSVIRSLMELVAELREDKIGLQMRVHELAAGKKAVEKQVREVRMALVDMAGELGRSRAGRDRAEREMGDAIRARDMDNRALKDDNSDLRCELATTKAVLELEAGRERPAGGAAADDLMSRPGLAVSTSLPARQQAQDPRQGPSVRPVGAGGGGGGGNDALAAENASLKRENASLKRENAVASGPNTSSRHLSLANVLRRRFRAVISLAYRKDSKKAGRKRGGQPGRPGRSNNDKPVARFYVPPPEDCPLCEAKLDDANPGTTRYWLRAGASLLDLLPVDEGAVEMLRKSHMLAGYGAVGRPECVTISFKRRECPCGCGVFERVTIAAIRGSAVSREDRGEIIGYCMRVPDKEIAKQMRAQRSFPLKAGAVRNLRGAVRDAVMEHNAKIPGRIGKEAHHCNDESTMKGRCSSSGSSGGASGSGGGGKVTTILEDATRASSPRRLFVMGACTKRLLYFRLRDSRSKATLSEVYREFLHVPVTADNYAGQPCEKHQNDMIHRIRGAEFAAFRATDRLARGGRMGADDLFVVMRREWEWARASMARIMGSPAAQAVPRLTDKGSPVPEPDAPSPDQLPDGSGRRRDADAARAAGDAIDDDAEALRGEVKAYFRLFFLYLFIRRWDTASESAAADLRDLVAAEILPLYGDKHPVRTSLSNALPSLFFALSVPGMPFDSNDIERAICKHVSPVKKAHVQVQSEWGATVTEELLTFTGTTERNGIDPASGLDRLLINPDWFAADDDDDADDGAPAVRQRPCARAAVRRVHRYRPTGPGPPPAPPPRCRRSCNRCSSRSGGAGEEEKSSPLPLTA